ncbi:PaaI family thioesterase [Alcaligenes sp. WGS1538]|uniref:PaaI family thioesterase n=1 Tax=Alcaligenes sp. WGS1538 TaxID=3366811 RepID=UPI00372D5F66
MDIQQARESLSTLFAPWVQALRLQVEQIGDGGATLRLPFSDQITHVAGVICGQVYMAAADTAMVLAVSSSLGAFRPMTTVSLNTSFVRPVSQGDVLVQAQVLKRGKSLAFGDVKLLDEQGRLVAHATTTYALLPA